MPEFYYPKTIVQYAEYPDQNISWSNNAVDTTIIDQPDYNFSDPDNGAGNKNIIQTVKNLTHIPNPTRGPKLDKTYYLKCTNFGITDIGAVESITGITLSLTAQRHGRIVDDTVCLIYQDQVISENKTNLSSVYGEGHLNNTELQIYGSANDMWGAELTEAIVTDPSFGVLLRFSSNPIYPHRDTMEVLKVLLTVHPFDVFVMNPDDNTEFIDEITGDYFIPE
jgi:hypothetical protein